MNHLKKKIERNYIYKALFGITFVIYLLLDLYTISILQKLIDSATEMNTEKFFRDIKVFIIVLIMTIVFIVLEQYFLRKITNYGNINLKKFTFKSFLNKNLYYEDTNNAGKVVSQLNSDIPIVSNWISAGLTTTIIQLIILMVCVALLFVYSPEIAIFVVFIIFITYMFAKFISIKTSLNMKLFQEMIEKISEKSYEGLRSIGIIRQLDKNKYFLDALNQISSKNDVPVIEKLSKYKAFENSELNFLADVLPLFTFVIGIFLTTLGRLTVGSAFAIMLITQKLNEPIIVLAELLTKKKTADEVYDRVKSLFETKIAEKDAGKLCVSNFDKLEVDLKAYLYPNRKDSALSNTKVEIMKGDVVSLCGESGKGKTTLINLISRFLPTEGLQGKILYNGENLERYQLNEYYKHVLQVEQNTILIGGSLEENLLLGDEYPKEDLDEIIKICYLEKFVNERGLDYYIEENGKNVSGGEKQRIGLARILLRRPDLLILDEVTSALNEEMRDKIVQRIIKYKEKYNLTIIAISHNSDFEKFSNKVCKL